MVDLRFLIDLCGIIAESADVNPWGDREHPHKRGDDEWFKLMFSYAVNVDEAKRLIAQGAITPREVQYPIRQIGTQIIGLRADEFGSENYEDSLFDDTPIHRNRLPHLPSASFSEPVLFIMFDVDMAQALVTKGKRVLGKPLPVLVDGNHRVAKRFLDGDEGTVSCHFIMPDEALRVTYLADQSTRLIDLEKARTKPARRPK